MYLLSQVPATAARPPAHSAPVPPSPTDVASEGGQRPAGDSRRSPELRQGGTGGRSERLWYIATGPGPGQAWPDRLVQRRSMSFWFCSRRATARLSREAGVEDYIWVETGKFQIYHGTTKPVGSLGAE